MATPMGRLAPRGAVSEEVKLLVLMEIGEKSGILVDGTGSRGWHGFWAPIEEDAEYQTLKVLPIHLAIPENAASLDHWLRPGQQSYRHEQHCVPCAS